MELGLRLGPKLEDEGRPARVVTISTTVNHSTPGSRPSTRDAAAPPYPGCCSGGDPRAGVNTPLRLIVRSPCIRVRGIAGCIFVDKGDGDTHIALLLDDKAAAKFLTPGNKSWTCDSDQGSDDAPRLVIEVIPQHCVVRSDNCADGGHFTDPRSQRTVKKLPSPEPWVQDTSTKPGARSGRRSTPPGASPSTMPIASRSRETTTTASKVTNPFPGSSGHRTGHDLNQARPA